MLPDAGIRSDYVLHAAAKLLAPRLVITTEVARFELGFIVKQGRATFPLFRLMETSGMRHETPETRHFRPPWAH
jgi:hypothetical protein